MNNLKILPSSTSFRAMNSRRTGKVMHNNARGLLKSLAVAVPLAFGVMNAPAKTNVDSFVQSEHCCNHVCNKKCDGTSFSNKSRNEEKSNENHSRYNSENKNCVNSDFWFFLGIIGLIVTAGTLCILTDDDRRRF